MGVKLFIDGEEIDAGVTGWKVERSAAPIVDGRWAPGAMTVKGETISAQATLQLDGTFVTKLLDVLEPPRRKGADVHTLAKRVFYGGRKGRRARQRLLARGLVPIEVFLPTGRSWCAMVNDSIHIETLTFDEHIRKHRIAHCSSTPCPKCGWQSPCCDHVEVDIGVGVQTGHHEYVCRMHGPFGYRGDGSGEPSFMFDDAS
jgi:hypothetical protein